MKSTYLRFLAIVDLLNGPKSELYAIDFEAKKLLEVIAVQNEKNERLTVTKAMQLTAIASPATIHRKLDQLREAGLIEVAFEGRNRRSKYLVPTDAANKYFSQIGAVMTTAVSGA